jgi:hypothetical protein
MKSVSLSIFFLILLFNAQIYSIRSTILSERAHHHRALSVSGSKHHSSRNLAEVLARFHDDIVDKEKEAAKFNDEGEFGGSIEAFVSFELKVFKQFLDLCPEIQNDLLQIYDEAMGVVGAAKKINNEETKKKLEEIKVFNLEFKLGLEVKREGKKWKFLPLFPGSEQLFDYLENRNKPQTGPSTLDKLKKYWETFKSYFKKDKKDDKGVSFKQKVEKALTAYIGKMSKSIAMAVAKWLAKFLLESIILVIMPALAPFVLLVKVIKILTNLGKNSEVKTEKCKKILHLKYVLDDIAGLNELKELGELSLNLVLAINYKKYKAFVDGLKDWAKKNVEAIKAFLNKKWTNFKQKISNLFSKKKRPQYKDENAIITQVQDELDDSKKGFQEEENTKKNRQDLIDAGCGDPLRLQRKNQVVFENEDDLEVEEDEGHANAINVSTPTKMGLPRHHH